MRRKTPVSVKLGNLRGDEKGVCGGEILGFYIGRDYMGYILNGGFVRRRRMRRRRNHRADRRRLCNFVRSFIPVEPLETRRLLTGTWTTVAAAFPSGGAQAGLVLTDGTLMVHGGGGNASAAWYKLTPSSTGSYTSGTWSALASSNYTRLYTATQVLQSGKVFVEGGEYSSAGSFTNTGEIYDPAANTWTNISPSFPQSQFGDDPSVLLPDGRVLTGYISGPQTYIYDPVANTWTAAATKLRNDESDEESWVTLPDHSILSYDVFASSSSAVSAQRYIPPTVQNPTGTWVDAGTPPALLSTSSVGYELGPGLLLPDGRAFFAGGTNATAYYSESTNSWTAGPNMPGGYVMADAPGAVLPNGNVLLAMSPLGTLHHGSYTFPSPTKVYELNTTTNTYTDVTPNLSNFTMNQGSYVYTFLVLPTGQVAMFNDGGTVAVYTESGSPLPAAVPVVSGISYNGTTGVYTLSGTNLNGINDGAAYGDDNQMASNYPLVRLTDSSGNVTYAKTTNWSITGVFQGAETVTFTLPTGDTAGAYIIQSVANGVASNPLLGVLVNAHTTRTVAVQMDANPAKVDVVGNGTLDGAFAISSFSSIYIVGDNSGDTLTVNLNSNVGSIVTTIFAGTGTDTININQTSSTGPVVISPSSGNDAVNVGTVGAGPAIVQFLASQQIGLLTIGSGGVATVTTGNKKLLQTNGVTISGTGVLDLTTNAMIVHGSTLPGVDSLIASGFNANGTPWTGAGITSSTAAANSLLALGVILNNNGSGMRIYGQGAPMGPFNGADPSLTDVLVTCTWYGDANLDGVVDGNDYNQIDAGYNHPGTWVNGDFNYDGLVNGSDYALIDNAFNSQTATPIAAIAAEIAGAPSAGEPLGTSTNSSSVGPHAGPVAVQTASVEQSDVEIEDLKRSHIRFPGSRKSTFG
jgi:hypothetical protein